MNYKRSKYFTTLSKKKIKYLFIKKNSLITVVFFHGFMSDITGKKPMAIQKFCRNFWKFQDFLKNFLKIGKSEFFQFKSSYKIFGFSISNILKFQIALKLVLRSPWWKSVSKYTGGVLRNVNPIWLYRNEMQGE